jgi:hypothetical protein
MIPSGQLISVPVKNIELDRENPRIRKFLEMYGEDVTPEQIHLALGAGGDDTGAGGGTTFSKLRNSILSNGGVIQPVIINRTSDGRLVCIEGNTRVALYQGFLSEDIPGNWSNIPALVHDDLDEASADAVRLQVHLVGPRPWDPYSKAKYLHHLRHRQHMPFSEIIDFCGGNETDLNRSISAYVDMEKYYRDVVPEDGKFDTTRFSGFVELQKPGIKEAILAADYSLTDFARWIHQGKLFPLNTVRRLPSILKNKHARGAFQKHDAKRAIAHLETPDSHKALENASLLQLCQALTNTLLAFPYPEAARLKDNPSDEAALALFEAKDEIVRLIQYLEEE